MKNVAVFCKNLAEMLLLQSYCKNNNILFLKTDLSSLDYSNGITASLTPSPGFISGYNPSWLWFDYGMLPTLTLPEFISQSIDFSSEDEDFLLL